jgi:phage tail protein X
MSKYTTSAGDTWDKIALNVYGSERYAEYLMANNQDIDLLSTAIFDPGVTISTPSLTAEAAGKQTLPPWRTS